MICADVGGTAVKSALISVGRGRLSQSYRIRNFCSVPTRSDLGFDGVRESVLRAVESVMTGDVADIVAIATAGEVDWDSGKVVKATVSLPGFCGYPFAEDLSERLGKRAIVINDACAAAICEHYFQRRKSESTLMLTIGTGLGSALVRNGKIDSVHVSDLELGHRVYVQGGYECKCGAKGCLEQYLSATAIKRDAGVKTVKEALTDTDNEKCVNSKATFLRVLKETVVAVKREYSPSEIVIGGGLAEMKSLWFDEFCALYKDNDVRIARLGNKAGLLGAAYAALNGRFSAQ